MFDLVAPSTSYKIDPAGADNQTGWTNKPVTVTFTATDIGGAGVDYTEYIVKTTSSTAPPATPGINESGTKGTSVVIDKTAPIGPNYVYYRSVDKACPSGNKEAWKLVMVFFDNVAPAMSDDTPDWWINKFPFVSMTGVATSRSPRPTTTAASRLLASSGTSTVIRASSGAAWAPRSRSRSCRSLSATASATLTYTATDKAGNVATGGNEIKIDTRGPVTDGASDWVNGLVPYVLTATDQVPGCRRRCDRLSRRSGHPVVDQRGRRPWLPRSMTEITLTGGQGAMHTIDFASVDAALPFWFDADDWAAATAAPSWHLGNWELDILNILKTGAAYKSRTVKLDVTAPVVTAMDPKNGELAEGPGDDQLQRHRCWRRLCLHRVEHRRRHHLDQG